MNKNIIITAVISSFLLAGCASVTGIKHYDDTIYVSKTTLEKSEVANIILQVGKDQGWEMEKFSVSRIKASKVSAKEKAFVQIKFDRSSFDIIYDKSENLSYDKNKNQILSTYNDWITDLRNEIVERLQKQ